MRKRILVVGTGSPTFRSYIMEHLMEAGFELLIAGDRPDRWKAFAQDFLDLTNLGHPFEKIVEFGRKHRVMGAITFSEEHVILAAKVARELGLPHTDPERLVLFRDKHAMRRVLSERQITSIQSRTADSPKEAAVIAAEIGFPVIVKPATGHSSIGVIKANQEAEVIAAAEDIQKYRFEGKTPAIIVEEYLDGPEVTMECMVENGIPTVVAVLDKRLSAEPFFEETGHTMPSRLPAASQAMLASLAVNAVQALGLQVGTACVEARLTSKGPRIIEAGARLEGDFIPEIIRLATGINLPVIAASLACGLPVEIGTVRPGAAAIDFAVPAHEGVIRSFSEWGPSLPHVVQAVFWGKKGQNVQLPPNRYVTRLGYVISAADTPQEAETAAKAALEKLELRIE